MVKSKNVNKEVYILKTRRWLANFVIGYNLCPFAKLPFQTDKIRYKVYEGDNLEQLALDLTDEILLLKSVPASEIETTLIIHPNVLNDFYDYNDFLEITDNILLQTGMTGELQIASFHPDYQFAETAHEDAENFTNRSPFPMLHLLREASVEKATTFYPDVEGIPERNIEKMRELGAKGLLKNNL
jgi:hypothetical protein